MWCVWGAVVFFVSVVLCVVRVQCVCVCVWGGGGEEVGMCVWVCGWEGGWVQFVVFLVSVFVCGGGGVFFVVVFFFSVQ